MTVFNGSVLIDTSASGSFYLTSSGVDVPFFEIPQEDYCVDFHVVPQGAGGAQYLTSSRVNTSTFSLLFNQTYDNLAYRASSSDPVRNFTITSPIKTGVPIIIRLSVNYAENIMSFYIWENDVWNLMSTGVYDEPPIGPSKLFSYINNDSIYHFGGLFVYLGLDDTGTSIAAYDPSKWRDVNGSFIDRNTGTPEAGAELRLYDTVNDRYAFTNGEVSFIVYKNIELVNGSIETQTIRLGSSGNNITVTDSLEVSDVYLRSGGKNYYPDVLIENTAIQFDIPLTSDDSLIQFGSDAEIVVIDTDGNEYVKPFIFAEPEGYTKVTLVAPVETNEESFSYGFEWTPTAGDEYFWVDESKFDITKNNIFEPIADAPWTATIWYLGESGLRQIDYDSGYAVDAIVPTTSISANPATVTVDDTITLTADTTDAVSFLWECSLAGVFSDATVEDTTFVPSESGTATFTQTVTSSDGSTASDTVDVEVEEPAVQTPPTAVIQNGSRTVNEGSRLYLYSTGSMGGSGTITGYQWSNDAGLVINNPNAAQCDLDPTPMVGQSFNVTLTVTNSNGDTDSVTETITVADITKPVIGLIGGAVELVINGTFTDPGANVTDNVDADTIIYSSDTVDVNTLGDQTISYNYTDAAGNVADPVTRTVTIVAAPTGPTAGVVQSNIIVNEGDSFTLDGTASLAGDTTIVTYFWEQISGADTAITNPNAAVTKQIAPDVELDSTLSFRLTVTDENDLSSSVNVTVSVQYVADPPSPFLDILELVSAWTVDKDSNITAYRGRANREILRFRPDAASSEGLELTEEGFLDLEGNDIVYLEIIMDGATNKLSTKTDSVKRRGDRLMPRMGDFIFPGKLSNRIVTVIAYVQGDTRGVVLSTEGSTTGIIKANTFIDVAVE